MRDDSSGKPPVPDLPKYLREPLQKQSPERLEIVSAYAQNLADWKRQQRQVELERRRAEGEVDAEALEELNERGISTEPADYEDVPTSGSYITVKTTKETDSKSYEYYY
jgi:hypothetical protein